MSLLGGAQHTLWWLRGRDAGLVDLAQDVTISPPLQPLCGRHGTGVRKHRGACTPVLPKGSTGTEGGRHMVGDREQLAATPCHMESTLL